jgi:hypothetical protein
VNNFSEQHRFETSEYSRSLALTRTITRFKSAFRKIIHSFRNRISSNKTSKSKSPGLYFPNDDVLSHYSWQTYWRHFKISRTKKIRFHFWSIKQKKKVHWCKKIAIRNVKFRFFWETQKKKKKKSSPRFISAFYFRLSCEKFTRGMQQLLPR